MEPDRVYWDLIHLMLCHLLLWFHVDSQSWSLKACLNPLPVFHLCMSICVYALHGCMNLCCFELNFERSGNGNRCMLLLIALLWIPYMLFGMWPQLQHKYTFLSCVCWDIFIKTQSLCWMCKYSFTAFFSPWWLYYFSSSPSLSPPAPSSPPLSHLLLLFNCSVSRGNGSVAACCFQFPSAL